MADPTFKPTVTNFTLEPADLSGHAYIDPRKLILTKDNLEAFQASKTHETIVSYIITLNECVVGVKLTDDLSLSPVRESAPVIPRYCLQTHSCPSLDGGIGLECTSHFERAGTCVGNGQENTSCR